MRSLNHFKFVRRILNIRIANLTPATNLRDAARNRKMLPMKMEKAPMATKATPEMAMV
jgi:hypothetical protein